MCVCVYIFVYMKRLTEEKERLISILNRWLEPCSLKHSFTECTDINSSEIYNQYLLWWSTDVQRTKLRIRGSYKLQTVCGLCYVAKKTLRIPNFALESNVIETDPRPVTPAGCWQNNLWQCHSVIHRPSVHYCPNGVLDCNVQSCLTFKMMSQCVCPCWTV